ncbi:MAG: ABC-three component system middle component 2 [Ferruginibacter sp.]
MNEFINDHSHTFNSPLECGLRSMVILECAFPNVYDLQRLVFFDYLLVHSADAGGPESLHPPTPHRSGEVLVRRKIIEQGLNLFLSRRLIEKKYTEKGIVYNATEKTTPFLDNLRTKYSLSLKDRANWVIKSFNGFSDIELENFFKINLDRWGGEFTKEASLKYGDL